jgi:hypothetical protein
VGKMFADDVAAGGAKDIADKEDIHWKSLHGWVCRVVQLRYLNEIKTTRRWGARRVGVLAFCPWHRVDDFN